MKNFLKISILLLPQWFFCTRKGKDHVNHPASTSSLPKPTEIVLIYEDVPRKNDDIKKNYKASITHESIHLIVYNEKKVFHDTTILTPDNFYTQLCFVLDSLKLQKQEEHIESGCDSGRRYKIKLIDQNRNEFLSGYAYYCGKLSAGNLSADPRPLFQTLQRLPSIARLIQE